MITDDFTGRLQTLVFNGVTDQRIQSVIDEFAETKEEENIAHQLQEDFRISYELAKLERGKVIDKLLIGTFFFIVSLDFTIYTIIVINRFSYWICAIIIFSSWFAINNFMKLQVPLEKFVPRDRIIKRRLMK